MKKIWLVMAVFLFASFAGCKSDSDVLSTYKGGDIKRGDFYKWLEAKRLKQDSLMKSKKKQKDKLEQMMLEKITIMKAREEGFDKNKDYLAVEEMATEGQLMKRLYDREVRDKATFSEEAVKMSQIFLRVKDYTIDPKQKNKKVNLSKADIEKENKAVMEKAADIIKKLAAGESFEELAKKYSEDFSKRKGGDMGFVVKDMIAPELQEIVFSMNPGDYSKEPVKTERGIYIVKVEEKKTLTEKNIDDVITDKGQAGRFKNGMLRKYAEKYIDDLMNAKDAAYYEDKALSKNKQAVLFKIGDKSFTVGDFNSRLDLKNKGLSQNMPKMPEINGERKKGLAKNYFKYEILKRNALEKGIDKDPEYLKEVE
ncbi:peptidylprolyl isomerase, partial [Candidatus Woesearchaeota archaeon]|nr:peptidylprolyl isomerase [Candidatus Woesearchaeota archaeon]